jgi:hypothetical protein
MPPCRFMLTMVTRPYPPQEGRRTNVHWPRIRRMRIDLGWTYVAGRRQPFAGAGGQTAAG